MATSTCLQKASTTRPIRPLNSDACWVNPAPHHSAKTIKRAEMLGASASAERTATGPGAVHWCTAEERRQAQQLRRLDLEHVIALQPRRQHRVEQRVEHVLMLRAALASARVVVGVLRMLQIVTNRSATRSARCTAGFRARSARGQAHTAEAAAHKRAKQRCVVVAVVGEEQRLQAALEQRQRVALPHVAGAQTPSISCSSSDRLASMVAVPLSCHSTRGSATTQPMINSSSGSDVSSGIDPHDADALDRRRLLQRLQANVSIKAAGAARRCRGCRSASSMLSPRLPVDGRGKCSNASCSKAPPSHSALGCACTSSTSVHGAFTCVGGSCLSAQVTLCSMITLSLLIAACFTLVSSQLALAHSVRTKYICRRRQKRYLFVHFWLVFGIWIYICGTSFRRNFTVPLTKIGRFLQIFLNFSRFFLQIFSLEARANCRLHSFLSILSLQRTGRTPLCVMRVHDAQKG